MTTAREAAERIAAYEERHYGKISAGYPGPSRAAEVDHHAAVIAEAIEAAISEHAAALTAERDDLLALKAVAESSGDDKTRKLWALAGRMAALREENEKLRAGSWIRRRTRKREGNHTNARRCREGERMADESHGVTIAVGTSALLLVNVENDFVGLSLTEHDGEGIKIRRVAIELHDREQLEAIRDFCIAQLERQSL